MWTFPSLKAFQAVITKENIFGDFPAFARGALPNTGAV